MRIIDRIKSKFTVSFEFFPPKTEEGESDLMDHIAKLKPVRPDYVSVTYGAGGSSRERTHKTVLRLADEAGFTVMAHLAVIGHTRGEVFDILDDYKNCGIENILALRGDVPAGSSLHAGDGDFPHTADLIRAVRERYGDDFCIGGAAFPEKHPESPDWEHEMRYFALKAQAGMDFAVSQLFFVNRRFFELKERMERMNLTLPVIPGIMPITAFGQIQKMAAMCGAEIPRALLSKLEPVSDKPEEVAKYGVEYAVRQCEELISNGVPGLHFYTMNKSYATLSIVHALQNLLPAGESPEKEMAHA